MPRFAACSFILRLLLYSLCLYIVLVLKCIYMSDIVLFNLLGYLAAVKCGRQVNPDNFLKSGAPKMDGRVDPAACPGCGESQKGVIQEIP